MRNWGPYGPRKVNEPSGFNANNVVRSLDSTLAPDGIRAVSVTVRGSLAREGVFTPDRVAEAIWDAVTTDDDAWRSEVPYSG